TVIVFTSRANARCSEAGPSAESVRVLRVDRLTRAESVFDVKRANCEDALGPFWIAWAARSPPIVAWAYRPDDSAPGAAQIGGLSFLTLGDEAHREGRIEIEADALAEGGCDRDGCFAAALERDPGADASHPESIVTFAIP
ncbi:MAG: hypothetical protein ACREJ3_18440, partial [Polyangiaceae bacterium]